MRNSKLLQECNFGGLVLVCIEADCCMWIYQTISLRHSSRSYEILNIFVLFRRSKHSWIVNVNNLFAKMLTGFAKSDQRFSNFGPNMATYWPICCQMFTMCLYFRLYFVRSHEFSSYSMWFFVIYFSKHVGFKTNSSNFFTAAWCGRFFRARQSGAAEVRPLRPRRRRPRRRAGRRRGPASRRGLRAGRAGVRQIGQINWTFCEIQTFFCGLVLGCIEAEFCK